MELINILESDLRMGYGNSYRKYRELIKELLVDFNNEEITDFKVEETEEPIIKNLKITTISNNIKDLKFTQIYNTSENTYDNASIESQYKKLTINYQPFSITSSIRDNDDYYKFVFVKEMSYNRAGIIINANNSYRNDDDKIDTKITYTTNNDNITRILNSINEATNYVKKMTQTKTLS